MIRSHVILALAAGLALAGPPGLSALAGFRAQGPAYLVLTAPWSAAEEVVSRAGGRLVGPRQPAWARVVTGEGHDFPDRLRSAGAWAVLGDPRLLRFCGVSS